MKWLKQKLHDWLSQGDTYASNEAYSTRQKSTVVSRSDIDSEEGLSITVRSAIGGRIVTFRHYDRRTDRSNHKLYIVPDDQDFERELGKMITLESMRG
jgi:hypothetical protein